MFSNFMCRHIKIFYCDFLCGIIFKIIFIEKERCFFDVST